MEKMIKRYVNDVLRHLPLVDRIKARMVITATIYERLEEYTNGLRPMRRDVKAVLREMGSPSKVAHAYYNDFHVSFLKRIDIKIIKEYSIQIFSVFALSLVFLGMMQLLLGNGNISSMVVGTLCGAGVLFYQMINQVREERLSADFFDTSE